MTLITADIRDAQGNRFSGFIRVSIDYKRSSGAVLYLPVSKDVPLDPNAAVSFSLDPTDLDKQTYTFEVYRVDGVYTTLVSSFSAYVPSTDTTLAALAQQTGQGADQIDTTIAQLARRLYLTPDFWSALQDNLFRDRGTWVSTAVYRKGDVVAYQGSSYQYLYDVIENSPVTDLTHWRKLASKGDPGSGTTGNNAAYDPNTWDNALDAPSRNAVRDIIETLATKTDLATKVSATSPVLDNPTISNTIPVADYTKKLVDSSWVQDRLAARDISLVPVGTVVYYGGTSAPTKWLACDGRTVSRTTYSELFAVLGTTYNTGGEAGTVFRLPDLRGRVPVGADNSPTTGAAGRLTTNNTQGASGGAETHVLTVAQMPAHSHDITCGTSGTIGILDSTTASTNLRQTSSVGGGQAHNNLQPYQVLLPIIFAKV